MMKVKKKGKTKRKREEEKEKAAFKSGRYLESVLCPITRIRGHTTNTNIVLKE